jgi:broad specificity phosphatase PhoE
MATTLTLICHASTDAVRRGAFPSDEPLDRFGERDCARAKTGLRRFDHAWVAPERRAQHTAQALDIGATIAPALRDLDHGRWAGKALAEIEQDALAAWLGDAMPPPHGGETVQALLARVADWMESRLEAGHSVAITHPLVVRAAVVHALDAGIASLRRIDVAPLDTAVLSFSNRWRLRSLRPLAEPAAD